MTTTVNPQMIEASRIMAEVLRLTKSHLAYVAVVHDNQSDVTMLGWSTGAMAGCTMKDKPITYNIDKMGVWGDAMRQKKVDVVNDYHALERPSKHGYPAGHIDVRRHMNGPVMLRGKVIGIIGVGNKQAEYTHEDEKAFHDYLLANIVRIDKMKVAQFG